MIATEIVSVSTVVGVDPATAFAVFTENIAAWWKPKVKHLFQASRTGAMKFERGPGGRLLEEYADAPPFEVGRVLTWTPGERLVFEWRQAGFAPHEVTQVDVRFEAVGGGTRVTLEHRGWDALPPDHPARHGFTGSAFTSMIGLRWADLLTGFCAFKPR
jgi:uncharacterized protein YndB with AHSA1/START domain